jgi:hypothetical protein
MIRALGLRQWHHAMLQVPAEHDLRRRLAVFARQFRYFSVAQAFAAGQRTPGLHHHAVRAAEVEHVQAVPERGPLDLVHGGHFAGVPREFIHLLHLVAAHAYVARQAFVAGSHQSFPHFFADPALRWPVDQDQVGILDLEFVEILASGVVAVVILFNLGDEVERIARRTGKADRLADSLLCVVVGRGVDHAIPQRQSLRDALGRVAGQHPGPETQQRHGVARPQRMCRGHIQIRICCARLQAPHFRRGGGHGSERRILRHAQIRGRKRLRLQGHGIFDRFQRRQAFFARRPFVGHGLANDDDQGARDRGGEYDFLQVVHAGEAMRDRYRWASDQCRTVAWARADNG